MVPQQPKYGDHTDRSGHRTDPFDVLNAKNWCQSSVISPVEKTNYDTCGDRCWVQRRNSIVNAY